MNEVAIIKEKVPEGNMDESCSVIYLNPFCVLLRSNCYNLIFEGSIYDLSNIR